MNENDIKNIEVPVCFWCGEAKTETKNTAAIVTKVLTDYKPCDKCQKKFKSSNNNVLFAKVSYDKLFTNQFPIVYDENKRPLYPTGDLVGVNPEAFPDEPVNKIICLQDVLFDNLFSKKIEKYIQKESDTE